MLIASGKAIFVHIQKTGGDAIRIACGEHSTTPPDKHFSALELRDQHGALWNTAYKFAFVRNPWDRLVSWWSMIDANRPLLDSGQLNAFQTMVLTRAGTFEEFLTNCDHPVRDVDGLKSIYRNQIDYLTDENGQIIVDFVGRFERLQADFDVAMQAALGHPIALAHKNKSEHRHYSQYYSTSLANIVGRRYERDIESFGYSFGD